MKMLLALTIQGTFIVDPTKVLPLLEAISNGLWEKHYNAEKGVYEFRPTSEAWRVTMEFVDPAVLAQEQPS